MYLPAGRNLTRCSVMISAAKFYRSAAKLASKVVIETATVRDGKEKGAEPADSRGSALKAWLYFDPPLDYILPRKRVITSGLHPCRNF